MKKNNIFNINQKKCREVEEEKYIEGAINCLAQARVISIDPRNNAVMLPYLITSVRGIFHCLKHTNTTLEDIGTSEKQLKEIINPTHLELSAEKENERWGWVVKINPNKINR